MRTQQPTADREQKAAGHVLLSARGLCMSFDGQQVLKGVNLNLREGQVVLLRGPNGSGKTTLVNILTGYLAPENGEIQYLTNGGDERFVFPRRWWQDLNPWDHFLPERVAREGVCRSWQETRLFPSVRLIDNIAVSTHDHPGDNPWNVLFSHRRTKAVEERACADASVRLENLGLSGRDFSSGDKVSLGQSKRVAIARAVSSGARVLFLDEPLSGLDASGAQSVMELLRSLVSEHQITLVIIEHVSNHHHIANLANTIWDLQNGDLTIQANGSTSVAAKEGPTSVSEQLDGFTFSRTLLLPRGARMDVYRKPAPLTEVTALSVENLVVRRGARLVIGSEDSNDKSSGIGFSLHSGDLAILQAPNGWGKTTLLDAISGLLPIERGAIHLHGRDITNRPAWARSNLGLRYVRYDNKCFPSLSVAEVLRVSRCGNGDLQPIAQASRYGQLSGGQKRRLQLHAIQGDGARILVLDEPFSALDEPSAAMALDAIKASMSETTRSVLIALPTTAEFETSPDPLVACDQHSYIDGSKGEKL